MVLTCTSSETEILNKIGFQVFILNFQVNLECFLTQKTSKVKKITHALNHDLVFYRTHNQLCVPEQIVGVQSTLAIILIPPYLMLVSLWHGGFLMLVQAHKIHFLTPSCPKPKCQPCTDSTAQLPRPYYIYLKGYP